MQKLPRFSEVLRDHRLDLVLRLQRVHREQTGLVVRNLDVLGLRVDLWISAGNVKKSFLNFDSLLEGVGLISEVAAADDQARGAHQLEQLSGMHQRRNGDRPDSRFGHF